MTFTSKFSSVHQVAADPITDVMAACAKDTNPEKIDVSVGVYKTEDGDPHYVFPCVREAKKKLAANDPGHCYTAMAGIPAFLQAAQRTVFGANHENVISVQAISGSGALHLALDFLAGVAGFQDFYVGVPAWGNYKGMIEHVGANFHTYNYLDRATNAVDFPATIEALESAKPNSVFIFQAVCHNPTGCDYSKDQWRQIFKLVKKKDIFIFFDIAYQGFASGNVDEDAWAIREAYSQKFEFVACQSYSKNMGLYAERVGCTHIVVGDKEAVNKVASQVVAIVRSEFSFAPAFGARVATIVQNDLQTEWAADVAAVTGRLKGVRSQALEKFRKMQTPGYWEFIVKQNGLFCYTGLTPLQVTKLIEEHSIYGTQDGRVNVAGLNQRNLDLWCRAVDLVVRAYPAE